MNKKDLTNAVRFACNGFIRPMKIHNIKYLSGENQYKVRCSELDDGYTYRSTLYFDTSFITRCLEFYKNGVRRWCNV